MRNRTSAFWLLCCAEWATLSRLRHCGPFVARAVRIVCIVCIGVACRIRLYRRSYSTHRLGYGAAHCPMKTAAAVAVQVQKFARAASLLQSMPIEQIGTVPPACRFLYEWGVQCVLLQRICDQLDL